ncbi:2-aminoethanethiol dioxygenase, partial [Caligus rogercresseyi]
IPHGELTISASSDPKILYPLANNIHEVQNASSHTPAAFLDILTPPYNIPDLPDSRLDEDVRLCNFYDIVQTGEKSVSLRIVDKPPEFICRTYKYVS